MLMLIIVMKVGPNWRYYHDRNEVVKPEIQVTCATCVIEENTDYSGFDIDIGENRLGVILLSWLIGGDML